MISRRVIRCWLLFAMMVAFQAVIVSTAEASCGDYLVGHRHRLAESPRDGGLLSHTLPDDPPLPEVPCNGPGCQKAPAEPLAPAPFQVSQYETQQLGCLVASQTLTPTRPTLPEADHDGRPHAGEPNPIEHPPRA